MELMLAILENRKPENLPKFVIEETLPAEPIPQIEWQYSLAAEAMLDTSGSFGNLGYNVAIATLYPLSRHGF